MAANFRLPNDHWVSRGLQVNFAGVDKRVAVLDVDSGRVVDRRRPVKSNFREPGFTTFIDAGVPNDLLERAFASVERSVLNEIRLISSTRRGPAQKAAVANTFAVHLVRSPSFKWFHGRVLEEFGETGLQPIVGDPELARRFELQFGRRPSPGELEDLVRRQHQAISSDPLTLVQAMVRQHDQMAAKLNGLHMQLIVVDAALPGLALGDTPVVHGHKPTGRYGFKDRLALGDADFIVGPLSRRTAVCFTARPLPTAHVRTRKRLDALNAIFVRGARQEVAIHPDDALALQQLFSRLDRIRPEHLFAA